MALTLEEVKERLVERYDSLELLEILGVTSEMLVTAFEAEIESRWDELEEELEEELKEFSGDNNSSG